MLLARYLATVHGNYRVYPYVGGEVTPSECHANMSSFCESGHVEQGMKHKSRFLALYQFSVTVLILGIVEKMRLDGKKGFVTGAARGIGKCTATAFA